MIDMIEMAKLLRLPEGENAKIVTELMQSGNNRMYDFTFDQLELNKSGNASVLEVGPANGYFVNQLFSINSDLNYTGLDLSADMVKEASKINSEFVKNGTASFIQGDLQSLPFENDSFDVIFTINTLYFWTDPLKCLNELKRVLKPKGKIAITIRSKETMIKMPFTEFGFQLYSRGDLTDLVSKLDFSSVVLSELIEDVQLPDGKAVSMKGFCILAQSV